MKRDVLNKVGTIHKIFVEYGYVVAYSIYVPDTKGEPREVQRNVRDPMECVNM